MGVVRFEDLRVWQAAVRQSSKVAALKNRPGFVDDGNLSDQLRAASLSVANNISEGFLRRRDREFAQFLRVAAASNGEVRSCLYVAVGRGYLDPGDAKTLIEESNAIGRMLTRLRQTLHSEREGRPSVVRPRTSE